MKVNKDILESEKLFSDGELIKLAIEYQSKLSYHKHRIFCNKMCEGDFNHELIVAGVDYVYDGLIIVNRILIPVTRILSILHEYMVYTISEKIPDGDRLPINYFCDFTSW